MVDKNDAAIALRAYILAKICKLKIIITKDLVIIIVIVLLRIIGCFEKKYYVT